MTALPFPRRGLYAVTDTALCRRLGVVAAVHQVIDGGAVVVQYRDKTRDHTRRREECAALLDVCHSACVPLVINDDIELAAAVGADGVHLGKDDGSPAEVRSALGEQAIVGVSCYDSIERALRAQELGATYVAFGAFFTSATKPDATPVALERISEQLARIEVPVVGIGGITADNADALLDAGIDLVAVISALFADPDPGAAASRFRALFAAGGVTRP